MNFDRLAPHYDWLEALTAGGLLQRVRTACLGELAGRRRILSAGEGHGRFAAACAARDAVWLVADFAVPAQGPARWRARAVHALMYAFFRGAVGLPARRLTPPDALLRWHGFERVREQTFNWGLLRAEVWRRG